MFFLWRYKRTTALIFGGLSALSFTPFYFLPASFASFSFLMFWILEAQSKRQIFVLSYLFGFAHFAVGLSWIGNALLIEPDKFGWLYPLAIGSLAGFFGLFFALPALTAFCARKRWQKWLVFCAMAVVFEWIRSFLFTGFPWNLLGYSFAFSQEMIQAAAWGGVYLLSLLGFLSYTVFGLWLQKRSRKSFAFATVIVLSIFAFLFCSGSLRLRYANEDETETLIEIVQPSIPQEMKWTKAVLEENFKRYLEMSVAYEQEGVKPDFIIWGETASPFVLDIDEEHRLQAAKILPEGSYLLTGMVSYQPFLGQYVPYNSMTVLSSGGEVVDYYHKSHLVPFGEYIPFREYLPDFIRPFVNVIGSFGKGEGPKVIRFDHKPSLGGIICYEVIFPHEIVNPERRPDFLVNLTNDGWYGDSAGPHQHWVAAKLRAVEEGIVLVRAANNGISGVVSAYGAEKGVLLLNEEGVSFIKLPQSIEDATIYEKFGNGVILSFCLILLFLGFIKKRK